MKIRFWVDVLQAGEVPIFHSEQNDLVYRKSEWGGYEWWNPTVKRFIVPLLRMDEIEDFRNFIEEMSENCVGKDFLLCVRQSLDVVGVFHRESLSSIRACDIACDGSLGIEELLDFLTVHGVMES